MCAQANMRVASVGDTHTFYRHVLVVVVVAIVAVVADSVVGIRRKCTYKPHTKVRPVLVVVLLLLNDDDCDCDCDNDDDGKSDSNDGQHFNCAHSRSEAFQRASPAEQQPTQCALLFSAVQRSKFVGHPGQTRMCVVRLIPTRWLATAC